MSKKSTIRQKKQKTSVSPLVVGGIILAALLAVAGLIYLGYQQQSAAAQPVDLEQFPALGDPAAPVTIVEYSDFGCPHCRDYVLNTSEQLIADYVDSGKVRYIVHSFNLGRPETAFAAEAAWCAADQAMFFEYQRALFENFGADPSEAALTNLAEQTGLDRGTFAGCLADRTHQVDVENARRAAIRQGINATPTFFINGQRVEGNQPYQVLQGIIEQALNRAG